MEDVRRSEILAALGALDDESSEGQATSFMGYANAMDLDDVEDPHMFDRDENGAVVSPAHPDVDGATRKRHKNLRGKAREDDTSDDDSDQDGTHDDTGDKSKDRTKSAPQHKKKKPKTTALTRRELKALRKAKREEEARFLRLAEGKELKQLLKKTKDKKARAALKKAASKAQKAAKESARAQLLHTEEGGFLEAEGMERTYKFQQKAIREAVDMQSAAKSFDLTLDQGPYTVKYSPNGRYLLMGGRGGHVAMFDWARGSITAEMQVEESVRDVTFFHNHLMFATAQKKYVHVYDNTGMELHCLREQSDVNRLGFLPHHFLMVSVGNAGYLKYLDVSQGELVSQHRTRLGSCDALAVNPWNAIVHLGHANGTVTLWSPNAGGKPLVKMLAHKGVVRDIAFDATGHHMITAGIDRQIHVWDIRTYRKLHSYYTPKPAASVEVSQRGMLAIGWGAHVHVWKDALTRKVRSPYLTHLVPGAQIRNVAFVPFEDVLGVGHARGISSMLVPGSGEANIDTYAANPYESNKQRQETEVKQLLDKIPADMITIDPSAVGRVQRTTAEDVAEAKRAAFEAAHPDKTWQPKYRKRGRSQSLRRYLRKKGNVRGRKREEIRERLAREEQQKAIAKAQASGEWEEPKPSVLDRFKKGNRKRKRMSWQVGNQ